MLQVSSPMRARRQARHIYRAQINKSPLPMTLMLTTATPTRMKKMWKKGRCRQKQSRPLKIDVARVCKGTVSSFAFEGFRATSKEGSYSRVTVKEPPRLTRATFSKHWTKRLRGPQKQ